MPDPEGFFSYDVRVGTITGAKEFPEARKPAFQLTIDFGPEVGEKQSAAQITDLYSIEGLIGKQVVGVVNFPPRQIGPFSSEVLVLGVATPRGVVLLSPEREVAVGGRVF